MPVACGRGVDMGISLELSRRNCPRVPSTVLCGAERCTFAVNCIPLHMRQSDESTGTRDHAKNPNFLLIVILSGVALIGLFLVAYLLVGDQGRRLLPGLHHDPQPTSWAQPSPDRFALESGTPSLV